MKTTTIYIADDGTRFFTESECILYEGKMSLKDHIAQNITVEFSDDANFSIITEKTVEEYIRKNISVINRLITAAYLKNMLAS